MFSRIFNARTSRVLKNLALGATSFALFNYYQEQQRQSQCCGIVGILSKEPKACEFVVNGLEIIKDKGYDSAGLASITEPGKFNVTKFANSKDADSIQRLQKEAPALHSQAFTAIGHTRWATCGKQTDANAHPHLDFKDRVAVVHNGLIENMNELRAVIKRKNIPVRSETDSELIAQLIGILLDENKTFYQATLETIKILQGTWGLAVIDSKNPKQMIISSHGSTLNIANDKNTIYVASDERAFSKYTSNYFQIMNKEIMLLDLDHIETTLYSKKDHIVFKPPIQPKKPSEPYNSFFEQEIEEQHLGISQALSFGARLIVNDETAKLGGLDSHREQILNVKNIVLVACGSSYYAALFSTKFFKILKCFNTVQLFEASEFEEHDLPIKQGGAIFISSSGETDVVKKALHSAKHAGIFTIGVVNRVGSTIASQTDCGVYVNSGREISCPATKSFTNQIVVLLLIALWVSKQRCQESIPYRKQLVEELSKLPNFFDDTIKFIENSCYKTATTLLNCEDLMVLAKGISAPIAKEGALKLKQVAYIHAEAFSSGEMKHGPIAMIDSTQDKISKVLLIILDNEDFNDMTLALSEVKARQAYTIVITDCKKKLNVEPYNEKIDEFIEILKVGELTPLLAIVVFQKIANYYCVQKKINPDVPRGVKFSIKN